MLFINKFVLFFIFKYFIIMGRKNAKILTFGSFPAKRKVEELKSKKSKNKILTGELSRLITEKYKNQAPQIIYISIIQGRNNISDI